MRETGAFLQYIPWLVIEIVKANMHVFKLAMTPKGYEEVAQVLPKMPKPVLLVCLCNSITPLMVPVPCSSGGCFHVPHDEPVLEDDLLEGAIEKKVANL